MDPIKIFTPLKFLFSVKICSLGRTDIVHTKYINTNKARFYVDEKRMRRFVEIFHIFKSKHRQKMVTLRLKTLTT